jgi:hypothetical protein
MGNRKKKRRKHKKLNKKSTPQTALQSQPQSTPVGTLETPPKSFFRRHTAIGVTAISLLASVVTLYAFRPKPTAVSAISSTPSNPYAMRFSLNNSGGLTMRNVDVSCDYTKLIFEHENTLILGDRFVASMYRVPDIASGEGFVVKCPEPWRYFTAKDLSYVVITVGDILPEYNARSFPFKVKKGGDLEAMKTPDKWRCEECVNHPVSDLDLTIMVKYRAVLPWITYTHSIRFIGAQGSDAIIAWQTVPLSQAPIKDPLSGPIFRLDGGQILATNDVSVMPKPR